jgi:hypothetical protein
MGKFKAVQSAAGSRFMGLLGVSICLCLSSCLKQEPTATDKSLCLEASDLENFGITISTVANEAEISRYLRFNGSHVVECKIHAKSAKGTQLFIETHALVEMTDARAVAQRIAGRTGVEIGLKVGGVTIEPLSGANQYGDESELSLLMKDGKPVGNYFSMRSGNKVYRIMLIGIYFKDPAAWDKVIHYKVDVFGAYKPD